MEVERKAKLVSIWGSKHAFLSCLGKPQEKKNHIRVIKDEEGKEWKKPKEIGEAFCNFYQRLLTAGDKSGVEKSLKCWIHV